MTKTNNLIYLILILTLNLACAENKPTIPDSGKQKLAPSAIGDSLTFTSGIRVIFQDSKGVYWFGSHEEGVCRFSGNTFEYFTTNEGLIDNSIHAIQEDEDGNIWFATARGVSCFNDEKFTNYPLENNPQAIAWSNTTGSLWFEAGTNQGVLRFDGKHMDYLAFPNSLDANSGNTYAVTGITHGINNTVWFATYAGVFGYNGKEFTYINDETLGSKSADQRVHVRSIFEDSKGRLWIGNNGIGVLLKSGKSITNFSKEQGKLMPMEVFKRNTASKQFAENTGLQSVFAITEDSAGNIWFGDRDTGAWKYNGKTLTNYSIDANLSSQMIWCIYEDQNKNILVGTALGGIYKFNGICFVKWY